MKMQIQAAIKLLHSPAVEMSTNWYSANDSKFNESTYFIFAWNFGNFWKNLTKVAISAVSADCVSTDVKNLTNYCNFNNT